MKNLHRYVTIDTYYTWIISLHYYRFYCLCFMSSHICFYTSGAAIFMSVCVFLWEQSHFNRYSLLFTQHVPRILPNSRLVRIDNVSNYEHKRIFNRLNKVTKKPYLPVDQLLFNFLSKSNRVETKIRNEIIFNLRSSQIELFFSVGDCFSSFKFK